MIDQVLVGLYGEEGGLDIVMWMSKTNLFFIATKIVGILSCLGHIGKTKQPMPNNLQLESKILTKLSTKMLRPQKIITSTKLK